MDTRQVKCAFLLLSILALLVPAHFLVPHRHVNGEDLLIKAKSIWDGDSPQLVGSLEGDTIRVILEYSSNLSLSEVLTSIQVLDCTLIEVIDILDFIVVETSLNQISKIQDLGLVYLDRQFHACLDLSVPIVKPGVVWSQVQSYFGYNITGQGVAVAVLDTGIQKNHLDLDDLDDNGTTTDPKVILEHSFVQGNADPTDDSLTGHGTHIAGIISGTGSQSGGSLVGVAPGCTLLNGKVLDANGVGWESWVIQGILWALGNGSDVINLSLATNESGDGSDALSLAVDYAVSQGVPVVLAAGRTNSQPYRIGMPGVSKELSVAPPIESFTKEEMLYDPDKYQAQRLYDQASSTKLINKSKKLKRARDRGISRSLNIYNCPDILH